MARKKGSHKGGKKAQGAQAYMPHRPKRGQLLAEFNSHGLPSSGYTMAQEARNTANNRRGGSGIDSKLRFRPVSFRSAGFIDPMKDFEVKPDQRSPIHPTQELDQTSPMPLPIARVAQPESPIENCPDANLFILDTVGDNSLQSSHGRNFPGDFPQDLADAESDSSEEVILFRGRDTKPKTDASVIVSMGVGNHATRLQTGSREADHFAGNATDAGARQQSLEPQGSSCEILVPSPEVAKQRNHDTIGKDANTAGRLKEVAPLREEKTGSFISLSSQPKQKRRGRKETTKSYSDDEEAAIIADYIANTQGGADDQSESECQILGANSFRFLRDLGGTDSDAAPGRTDSADETSDHSHTSAIACGDVIDDEHFARLLAKQDELGIDVDDLVLLESGDAESDAHEGWQNAPGTRPRRQKKGASKQTKIVKEKGQFPSATDMANAFDDLDLMDWHRPSLNNFGNNKKKKKTPPVFDISDSELEEAMNIAWQNDRLRKTNKKKEREELRSQGLLGKNVDPDDLRTKYRAGMSIDDLENEMEVFLTGTREQIMLPPFDTHARKIVHQVANRLQLKSKSAGKGSNRHPVLYRTKKTIPFNQQLFDQAFGHIKRSWFPRVDVDEDIAREAKALRRAEPRAKQRSNRTLTHYREGDIVGADAKELGTENKGRAMLEKMGWSKGMALGTEENKGIIAPIQQVVKKTKAGLGEV